MTIYNTSSSTINLRELGEYTYRKLQSFKNEIRVGDIWHLPQDILAMQNDFAFSGGFDFTVIAKYPHCVLLEKAAKKGAVHRQSVSYWNLMTAGKHIKRGNKDGKCTMYGL